MENTHHDYQEELRLIKDRLDQIAKAIIPLTDSLLAPRKDDNDIINMQQASELTGLSINTLYSLRSKGKIPCLPKGRFSRSEIIQDMQKGRRKTIEQMQDEAINGFMLGRRVRSRATR